MDSIAPCPLVMTLKSYLLSCDSIRQYLELIIAHSSGMAIAPRDLKVKIEKGRKIKRCHQIHDRIVQEIVLHM